MSALGASGWAAGLLLVVAGIWLLLQTLVGELPSRVLKLGGAANSFQPGVGTGPGGSNVGNPPGYDSGSPHPGGSPTTPPAGWQQVLGSQGEYYNPQQPGEIWIPGKGILQQ